MNSLLAVTVSFSPLMEDNYSLIQATWSIQVPAHNDNALFKFTKSQFALHGGVYSGSTNHAKNQDLPALSSRE